MTCHYCKRSSGDPGFVSDHWVEDTHFTPSRWYCEECLEGLTDEQLARERQ